MAIHTCQAQKDSLVVEDAAYKEDQFYIGVTYNLLGKKDNTFSQRGFSSGIHFGIIKDMPLNDTRNLAVGIGLGYSLNSFNQNLLIFKDDMNTINFELSVKQKKQYVNIRDFRLWNHFLVFFSFNEYNS